MTGPGGHADATYLLDASGPSAPPRDNGELIFAVPWESQAFGVALALHEAGRIEWEDFRQLLIAEIGSWEATHSAEDSWSYYKCWLGALERLVSERGLVSADDLRARVCMLTARPPDHRPAQPDHDHRHRNGHAHTGAGHAS